MNLSRRDFLSVCITTVGGLFLALHASPGPVIAAEHPPGPAKIYPPSAFVHMQPNGKIIIQVNRLEFGQGVQTSLPMVLADEMDADWSQVEGHLAPAEDVYRDPVYGIQMVGGSGSIAHSFEQYRELGARARAMLVAAAAINWKVTPEECHTKDSVVHGPAGQSATYAELADAAAQQPVPTLVKLKEAADFRLVGKATPRLDSRPKCDGSVKFGIDLDLPGMKIALVAHPPVFGGKVKAFDEQAARRIEGVRDVFEVSLVRGSGVAVIADGFWAAKLGRDALNVTWDLSGIGHPDSAQLWQQFKQLAGTPGHVAADKGDAQALSQIPAGKRLLAEYEFPYLAHAPMEPLNTTIRFDGDSAEVWAGSQFQTVDRIAIAETLGLTPEKVTFHTEMAGGGFGRRAVPDSHLQREAAVIAKRQRGIPVKLMYTREEDIQGGYYRPMHLHRVEVGIGPDGLPLAWKHVIVGQSLTEGTPFAPMTIHNGVDSTMVEGVADTHYRVPNLHVEAHHPQINVPVLWWRSVGHTHTAFVMETLIDELAVRAGVDPFVYRRRLIEPEATKLLAALNLADEKSKWRHAVGEGHAVGIACHESFGTGVACVVDVSIHEHRPRIHRVTIAVDAGLVVNPLSVEAQFQAGVAFGLTQLVPKGAITFKDGRVEQRNFDGYAPPYIMDAPMAVDVHIVPSTDKPTGCGEPPVPVISPAVVNAMSRLTGQRYRHLPLA